MYLDLATKMSVTIKPTNSATNYFHSLYAGTSLWHFLIKCPICIGERRATQNSIYRNEPSAVPVME